jgi:hypothetical protein
MSMNLKFKKLVLFLFFLNSAFISNQTYAQHGSEREIQFAREIKEDSERRVERVELIIREAIDEIKNKASNNIDEILRAEYECKNKILKSTSNSGIHERFSWIQGELDMFQKDLESVRQSMDRRLSILENDKNRTCFSGSNERIESYSRCLLATEKGIFMLNNILAVKTLQLIQKHYVNEPYEKYRACTIEKNNLLETSFLNSSQSAIKTNAIIKSYSQQLKSSSDSLFNTK